MYYFKVYVDFNPTPLVINSMCLYTQKGVFRCRSQGIYAKAQALADKAHQKYPRRSITVLIYMKKDNVMIDSITYYKI